MKQIMVKIKKDENEMIVNTIERGDVVTITGIKKTGLKVQSS